MQTEIRARRAERDSLKALHDELADRITAEANAILSERDRRRREERRREQEQWDREKFRKTWNAVTETEQERVKRHEAIHRWFDKDA